jgi:CRISPR-associated endonuclease/helicase Cas3
MRGRTEVDGEKLAPDTVYALAARVLPGQPLLAKSAKDEKGRSLAARYCRKQFRHELASALGWLGSAESRKCDAAARALVAYLIAAHHGKVRLSIRSMPGEDVPDTASSVDGEPLFARGIWQDDAFPVTGQLPLSLPDGDGGQLLVDAPLKADLTIMRMGSGAYNRPSWLEMTLMLRDTIGPFRLAWLETILRSADARASKAADTVATPLAAI